MMSMSDSMMPFDYRELFTGEIIDYTKYDMEYAIEHDIDLSEGVIDRLNDYQRSFKIVKGLIRAYWGRISYLIDNPDTLIDFIHEKNPELFEIDGAEAYMRKQIQKAGYALYNYIQPSAKVKVKLQKKADKFKKKMEKD